jgi:hypothetical protein
VFIISVLRCPPSSFVLPCPLLFRFPFRTKCWDWAHKGKAYSFCPFNEVTVGGRSFGKAMTWGPLPNGTRADALAMHFTGGDATNCPGFRPRACVVEMACSASYGLVAAKETGSCHLTLTFNTPVACT